MNVSVLIRPLLTEKTLQLAQEQNGYTFMVSPQADKNELKEVFEAAYDVKVTSIKTVTIPAFIKRTGRKRLRANMPAAKKAIFFLNEKDKLELFSI